MKIETIVGLLGTLWFSFTHPGHEGTVCAALAALWGYTHGHFSGPGTDKGAE